MTRKIETSTGVVFEVRALKRGEVRKLREQGVDVFNFDGGVALSNVDAVLDTLFPGSIDIDELPFPDAANVFRGIMAATLGTEEEVKNS